MSSRLVVALRAIVGGIVGALLGAIVLFVVAGAISAAIGNSGGWALGLVMVTGGLPVAVIVGAILGGVVAATRTSSPVFRFTAVAALSLVALAIGLSAVLPDNRPRPHVDVKGCTISPRVGSFGYNDDPRYVVVYDRYCPDGEGHTVNVSVFPTSGAKIEGPGNILVLEGNAELEARLPGHEYNVFATPRDSTHWVVDYDHRAHVLSQASPVLGYVIAFRPDSARPRPAGPPSELVALFKARMDSIAARDASLRSPPPPPSLPPTPATRPNEESFRARRESMMVRPKLEPWVFTDSEGCTIRKRLHFRPNTLMYVLYERICEAEPRRTMNVAQVGPAASVDGPGNVLVLVNDEPARADSAAMYLPVSLTPRGPQHIDVVYAARYHVLRSGSSVGGVEFTFRADSEFRPMGFPPTPTSP